MAFGKLSIGNTDDQQQRHMCSLSSFTQLYEMIKIVKAWLPIAIDLMQPCLHGDLAFAKLSIRNTNIQVVTVAAPECFVQFYSV